jgi:hypothetical protein
MLSVGGACAVVFAVLASRFAFCQGERPARPPAEQGANARDQRLAEPIRLLLELGFERGPKQLEAARRHLDQARRLAPDDPRVDYAWGLVLLDNAQHKQASAHFDAAVKSRGQPHWPAWQALIWACVVEKQFDKALELAESYARLVARGGAEQLAERQQAARWLGRLLAALRKTAPSGRKLADQVVDAGQRLAEILGQDLRESFELGESMVEELHAALEERSASGASKATDSTGGKQPEAADRVKNRLEELEKERTAAERSAEEWKKWLDQSLEKADKALEAIEKEYQALDARGQALERQIVQLGQDLTRLEVQGSLGAAQQGTGATAAQLYNQKQNQLLNCQLEYNANAVSMQKVGRRGQLAMQERAAIIERYQKATGDLVKKSADLDKWSSRAQEVKKKYDLKAASKAGGAKKPARSAPSFKAYLPLDPRALGKELLQDLGLQLNLEAASGNS